MQMTKDEARTILERLARSRECCMVDRLTAFELRVGLADLAIRPFCEICTDGEWEDVVSDSDLPTIAGLVDAAKLLRREARELVADLRAFLNEGDATQVLGEKAGPRDQAWRGCH